MLKALLIQEDQANWPGSLLGPAQGCLSLDTSPGISPAESSFSTATTTEMQPSREKDPLSSKETMIQTWVCSPHGGFERKESRLGCYPRGAGEKTLLKCLVRTLELNHELASKPQDLEVVFQIPIRNPIIKRDWR